MLNVWSLQKTLCAIGIGFCSKEI